MTNPADDAVRRVVSRSLMLRTLRARLVAVAFVARRCGARRRRAERPSPPPSTATSARGPSHGRRRRREPFTPSPAVRVSPYLYLNRCTGGCTVNGGDINDARTQHVDDPGRRAAHASPSTRTPPARPAPPPTPSGPQVVQCMKEVYSPFNVDGHRRRSRPAASRTPMAIIARQPGGHRARQRHPRRRAARRRLRAAATT